MTDSDEVKLLPCEETVEHVARAICWAFSAEDEECQIQCLNARKCMTTVVQDCFKRDARAAIEAMSRPPVVTDEVVEPAYIEGWMDGYYTGRQVGVADPKSDWLCSDARKTLASMPAVVSGGQST